MNLATLIVFLSLIGSFCGLPASATETPKVKCTLEKIVQIHLPQVEMQCRFNDGKKIVLEFPVQTGKFRQVTYGAEEVKIPEKESKLYDFDPVKLELIPLQRNEVSDKAQDTVSKQDNGEFTHFDSKGRKWEVLCGQHFLKLKCFDKGKMISESKASWARRLNNTDYRPINDVLDHMNLLYSYEFENWPFPPTVFLKIVFDKKDNPILLTEDQGLFRFENGHWKWIFYTPELQLDEISSISILPDNRICLVTHPSVPGADYKRLVRRNGIVIYDPVRNEYQIVRIKLTG